MFETLKKEDCFIICFPKLVNGASASTFESNSKLWLLEQSKFFVFDFSATAAIESVAYRPLVLFFNTLKKNGKYLFSVGLSVHLVKQSKQDGLFAVFSPVKDIQEGKARYIQVTAPKKSFDIEFIKPFISATETVLKIQAGTELKAEKPYAKKPEHQSEFSIAGVLNINSTAFHGSISLCFTTPVFLKIYENMVGEKIETVTPDSEDAVGELLNIIFGQAKTILIDQKGYSLEKAIPTVLVGEKLRIRHKTLGITMVLPFVSPWGPVHVEISLEDRIQAAA